MLEEASRLIEGVMDKQDLKAYSVYALFLAAILLLSGCSARCMSDCMVQAVDFHLEEHDRVRNAQGLTDEEKDSIIASEDSLLEIQKIMCEIKCR